jgi:phage-related protein
VEEDALSVPAGLPARLLRYAEEMEEFGPDLGMPHTRALGGGLFELRLKGPEGIARSFYTSVPGRIVLLHLVVKKSRKLPRNDIEMRESA